MGTLICGETQISRYDVTFQGETWNLSELYSRFSKSTYGLHQSSQTPRFYRVYGVGKPEEFQAILGDDSHPVRHMAHTVLNLAVPFVESQRAATTRFSSDDEAALLITAATHDIDECEHPYVEEIAGGVVGDIPKHSVTEAHELTKKEIRDKFVYGTIYPDFSYNLRQRIEEIMSHDPNDPVANAFNKIEQIGYVSSGLVALTHALSRINAGNTLSESEWAFTAMGHVVPMDWRESLENDRETYPYIDEFLIRNRRLLNISKFMSKLLTDDLKLKYGI